MARAGRVTDELPASPSPSALPREVVELLGQPLDPKLVARRKGPRGSGLVAFIEGFRAIDQANRIFGYGNWGGEVVGDICYQQLQLGGEPHETAGMYWATVRVRVRDCASRSDVGCGFATEATVEAHDTAIKAAVTDALKRALRQWGPQFGNSLYDRASPTRLSSARELSDLRSAVLALGAALGLDENSTRKHAAARAGKPFNSLTPTDLAGLLKVMAEAVTKRQKAA